MTHFSGISAHRSAVLTLYRHTLRNTNNYLYSKGFANSIQNEITKRIRRNRKEISSWATRTQLETLSKLNDLVLKCNWDEVKKLLIESNAGSSVREKVNNDPKIANLNNILNVLTPLVTPKENPSNTKEYKTEMNILSDYCKRKQLKQLLPRGMSKEYKRKLLLPIAMHEHGLKQVGAIARQLKKGPPPAYLSYTMEGKSKIWFVRSAVNKHKNQSKALGRLIRETRFQHQSEIDTVALCHSFHGYWALEEAQWEGMLETQLDEPPRYKINSLEQFLKLRDVGGIPQNVIEWLQPLKDVIKSMQDDSNKRVEYFEKFKKENLIDGGQYDYYQKESDEMYWKRKERFEKMIKEQIPYTNPFYKNKENNLISILKHKRFISFE